jgi:CubicO group peptidase (beta-lactamase class C family)
MKPWHLIMALAWAAAPAWSQPNHESGTPIGPALQKAMEMSFKDSGAIGVSAAFVFPGGEVWAGTTGVSHAGVPLTTDMLFEIASVQKNLQAEYSTTNYIVRKQVIEKAAHSKLPSLAEERLLRPNRLDHTLVDFFRPVSAKMRVVHGWFDTDDDGSPEDISGRSLNWIASLAPMLVYSTPTDFARWMHALFHRKQGMRQRVGEGDRDRGRRGDRCASQAHGGQGVWAADMTAAGPGQAMSAEPRAGVDSRRC